MSRRAVGTTRAVGTILAVGLALGTATPAAAVCPQGDIGALPVTLDTVKVRPYRSTSVSTTTPSSQQNCFFLENTSAAPVSPLFVDSRLEEPGTGVIGPWPIASFSSINISGGVAVTCSVTANVARIAPTGSTLAGGAITDICCFVWEAPPPGSCAELPDAGDLARHTSNSGTEALMPILSYIPVGGTTCGLIGLEIAILAPLLSLRRGLRRRQS